MRTTAWGIALAFSLVSHPLVGREAKEPTRTEKADDLAEKLDQMRNDYRELLSECWGRGYYLQEPEGEVWYLSEAPDPESCKEAETLKDDYRSAYKKLLKLDRRRVLFDDIPKYIDRS